MHDSRSTDKEMNPEPPENEARLLSVQPQRSVIHFKTDKRLQTLRNCLSNILLHARKNALSLYSTCKGVPKDFVHLFILKTL
jgi:hypothetical protein